MSRRLFVVLVPLVLSRTFVLVVAQPASDVEIYAEYVQESRLAATQGRSFYAVHAERALEEAATVQKKRDTPIPPAATRSVEYPPLAVAAMHLPTLWMAGGYDGALSPPSFPGSYLRAYRASMAVVDVALLALVALLVERLFAAESAWARQERLLVYVLSTAAIWYLLYDRLDLVLALLVVVSLALLCSRVHYVWSFAALAMAINFKLAPLVLAPIWVVGALPAQPGMVVARTLLRLGARAALLIVLVVGLFLPFYLVSGPAVLGFLSYHGNRGIEFESLYGSVLLAGQRWWGSAAIAYVFKSVCVVSPPAGLLARWAPALTLGLLLGATGLVLVHGLRLTASGGQQSGRTLAQLAAPVFAGYTLLFLMIVVLTSKVFSPQYLLWIAPLAPLAPLRGRARAFFLWGFVLVCILSTVVFPFLFSFDMADRTPGLSPALWNFRSPTPRLITILVLRNLLFGVLTVTLMLVARQWRSTGLATLKQA